MGAPIGEAARADRARTGHSLGRGVPDLGGILWQAGVDGPVSGPVVSGGVVCVGTGAGLRAFDTRTGQERWHRDGLSGPVALDGVIHALRGDRLLCALDARTGATLRQWEFVGPTGAACRAMDAGTAYLVGAAGGADSEASRLTAFDLRAGRERWAFETEQFPITSEISFAGDAVCFFETGDSHDGWSLYALEKATGALRWEHEDIAVGSAAPVAGRRVYFTDNGGFVSGLSLKTGAEEWRCDGEEDWDEDGEDEDPPSGIFCTEPALDAKNVYVRAISDDLLYAVDRRTRGRRWVRALDEPDPSDAQPLGPSVAGGMVYLPASNVLYALQASDGDPLWKFWAEENISSEIVLVDGALYFTAGRSLYALGEQSGEKRRIT